MLSGVYLEDIVRPVNIPHLSLPTRSTTYSSAGRLCEHFMFLARGEVKGGNYLAYKREQRTVVSGAWDDSGESDDDLHAAFFVMVENKWLLLYIREYLNKLTFHSSYFNRIAYLLLRSFGTHTRRRVLLPTARSVT